MSDPPVRMENIPYTFCSNTSYFHPSHISITTHIPSDLVVKSQAADVIGLILISSGAPTVSTGPVAIGNQGVRYSQHLRPSGLPLNAMECGSQKGELNEGTNDANAPGCAFTGRKPGIRSGEKIYRGH